MGLNVKNDKIKLAHHGARNVMQQWQKFLSCLSESNTSDPISLVTLRSRLVLQVVIKKLTKCPNQKSITYLVLAHTFESLQTNLVSVSFFFFFFKVSQNSAAYLSLV